MKVPKIKKSKSFPKISQDLASKKNKNPQKPINTSSRVSKNELPFDSSPTPIEAKNTRKLAGRKAPKITKSPPTRKVSTKTKKPWKNKVMVYCYGI